jgi:hypothetical protein
LHIVFCRLGAVLLAVLSASAAAGADLTAVETRWLQGAWPVVLFAREAKLPVDIVVQPQPSPGAAPLALGFVDGRCKLVLSMRANPQAQATLDRIEPALLDVTLELMAAHELGHCRRYVDGAWHEVPAGFTPAVPAQLGPELHVAYLDMKAARREEAYADLVGLAWTQRHHPEQYGSLQRWLVAERSKDLIPGEHHDTLAWLQLAEHGVGAVDGSIFEQAAAVWKAGLDR